MPELKDWLTIIALVLTPCVVGAAAVLVPPWIEERREKYRAKRWILTALMQTRFTPVADDRIRAFNSIDLIFQDDPDVCAKWASLLEKFKDPTYLTPQGAAEANRRLLDLMSAMAKSLGYKSLSQTSIDRSYAPDGYAYQATTAHELTQAAIGFFRQFTPPQQQQPLVQQPGPPPPAPPPSS